MRNLKKALSLVLAMVMLLGMMVVGAGAANFKDDAEISDEYRAATAVLKAIGVMEGTDGYLNPKEVLSRVGGAAIIYRLFTGGLDKNPVADSGFVDVDNVPSFSWASGTVAACRDLGIVSGVDATHFNPGEPLTVAAFSKMLLVTLGYEADKAEYTGASWESNVARDARARGILLNGMAMNATLTREQAAQMTLQALIADTVEYNGMNVSIGDTHISSPATVRKYASAVAGTTASRTTYEEEPILAATTSIKFCEEKFPLLKLSKTEEDNFGHTASVWKYKGVEIKDSDTSIDPDIVYTNKVDDSTPEWAVIKGRTFKSVGGSVVAEFWVNGAKVPNYITSVDGKADATSLKARTANGRLVEVYLNKADLSVIDKVVITDTVLGEVTKVNNAKEEISIKLQNSTAVTSAATLVTEEGYGEFKVGDLVLVQGYDATATTDGKINADTTVSSVREAPQITGLASVKGYTAKVGNYIMMKGDGTKYVDAYAVVVGSKVSDFNLSENYESTLVTDEYGYILKAISGEDPNKNTDKLIAVTDSWTTLENGRITCKTAGVLSNGEAVTITTNQTYQNGRVFRYAYNSNTKQYTLTQVAGRTYATMGSDLDSGTYTSAVTSGTYEFKSTETRYNANGAKLFYSDEVKFIYLDGDKVTVLDGQQNSKITLSTANTCVAFALRDERADKSTGTPNYEIVAVYLTKPTDVVNVSDIIFVASRDKTMDKLVVDENGKNVKKYGYKAYTTDGEQIEGFLGDEDYDTGFGSMFTTSRKTVYKDLDDNEVDVYAMRPETKNVALPDVVLRANGVGGNAFYAGARYYLARSDVKVVDLSGKKLDIQSVSEINELVNKENREIKVAVVFNETTGDKEAMTVYVTSVGNENTIPAAENYVAFIGGSSTEAELKAVPDGAYRLSTAPDEYPGTDWGDPDHPEDTMMFKWSVPAGASASSKAVIKIQKKGASDPVYVETFTTATGNSEGDGHLFWVRVEQSVGGTPVTNAATGASPAHSGDSFTDGSKIPTTGLTDGIYNWAVYFSTNGSSSYGKIAGGQFTID